MTFTGFTDSDFETFEIAGLAARMEAIQGRIQPKFKVLGEELTEELSLKLGYDMHLHIARHARRTVNAPNDTWLAIADNKRGYKKHPHFQVGLFDSHLFIWLALIYELPNKRNIAEALLEEFDQIKQLPENYVVSFDHLKKEAISLDNLEEEHLIRFRDVKKAEFLVGRHVIKGDILLNDGAALIKEIKTTYDTLLPLYQLALRAR